MADALFSESHKRHLLVTFRYVDELLTEAASQAGEAESDLLFPRYMADATAVQRRIIGDHLRRLRLVLRRFLEAQQLEGDAPNVSGLWAFRCSINFAQAALEDANPAKLAGYGALASGAAEEIERLLAEVNRILDQLSIYLERGLGGDISTRLERLDGTRNEVQLLRELVQIIEKHGLVEFRATLDWLLERCEQSRLEVVFFGRVSAGKSSLLNYLIGQAVLPTGVTPVTAIPTRVVAGAIAQATVSFMTGKAQRIALDQIAEFASEERNPGNFRQVSGIVIELPSERLGNDVCLVDTPGLGSLATAGAAETLAFLPRCDVGVLLTDAGGTLVQEDIDVARAILEAGAVLLPIISKADLLSSDDRQKMCAYVSAQLANALNIELPVFPVSAIGEQRTLSDAWFEQALAPQLGHRKALVDTSLRRKIGALREAVVAALQVRLSGKGRHKAVPSAMVGRQLADARAELSRFRRQLNNLIEPSKSFEPRLWEDMAQALASAWEDDSFEANPGHAVMLAIAHGVDGWYATVHAQLSALRNRLSQALAAASSSGSHISDEDDLLPTVAGCQRFDPMPVVKGADLGDSIASGFGKRWRLAAARRRVKLCLGVPLTEALRHYEQILKSWGIKELLTQEQAFEAATAAFDAVARVSDEPHGVPEDSAGIADLERLNRWNDNDAIAKQS